MENKKLMEEPLKEENESYRPVDSLMFPISISMRSVYNNADTSINLNYLLLETVQTLNIMRNIISNFDIQENMLLCQKDEQREQQIKTENLLQKNKLIMDKFYNGINTINDNDLSSPKMESQQQVKTITMVKYYYFDLSLR